MLNEKLKKALITAKDTVFENALLTTRIEIVSNNHTIIQGAKGVTEYEKDIIRIKLNNQEVQFFGTDFIIEYLANDCIEIRGEIINIEFL